MRLIPIIIIGLIILSSISFSATALSACGTCTSAPCTLTQSIVTTANPCIITAMYDFNMQGFTITQNGAHVGISINNEAGDAGNGYLIGFTNTNPAISLSPSTGLTVYPTVYNMTFSGNTIGDILYTGNDGGVDVFNTISTNAGYFISNTGPRTSLWLKMRNLTITGATTGVNSVTGSSWDPGKATIDNVTFQNCTVPMALVEHTNLLLTNIQIYNPTTSIFTNAEADTLTITNLTLGWSPLSYKYYPGANTFTTGLNPAGSAISGTDNFISVNSTDADFVGLITTGTVTVAKTNVSQNYLMKETNVTKLTHSAIGGYDNNNGTSFSDSGGSNGYYWAYFQTPFRLVFTSPCQNATVAWENGTYSGNCVNNYIVDLATVTNGSRINIVVNNAQKYEFLNNLTSANVSLFIIAPSGETTLKTITPGYGAIPDALVRSYAGSNNTWQLYNQQYSSALGVCEQWTEVTGRPVKILADKDSYGETTVLENTQNLINETYYVTMSHGVLTFITPSANAQCTGVNATNTISCSYNDTVNVTHAVNFLVYRQNVSVPVCNSTVNGSVGSYDCVLSPPENISKYLYGWQIWRNASPYTLQTGGAVDLRAYPGVIDWAFPALILILVLGVSVHPAIGIGLASISLFAVSALNLVQISSEVTVPIMLVGFVVAYLLSKRGGD